MAGSAEETHYVLVIHGTWNAPTDGRPRWYQLDPDVPDNFCGALNKRLEALGIGRAVWRTCGEMPTEFLWPPADNTHEARIEAGQRLARHIVDIALKDPTARIHLVAHSHGGNVVLKALELYLTSFLPHQAKYAWAQSPAEVVREELWAGFEAFGAIRPQDERSDASWGDVSWCRESEVLREFAEETGEIARPSLARFTSWWTQSATHNRLGRIVFLGTPFYLKSWGRRWFASRVRAFVLEAPFWVGMLGVAGFVVIEAFWLVTAALSHVLGLPLALPTLNPAAWPVWLLVVWGLIGSIGLRLARKMTVPIDSNLYFEQTLIARSLLTQRLSLSFRRALPLEVLVVTGWFLDEVYLLMASEPIIYSALASGLYRLVFRKREWQVRSPTGLTPGYFAPKVEGAVLKFRRVFARVIYPVTWPFKKLLAWYLTRTLFRFLKASGLGIDPAELADGRVNLSLKPSLRYVMRENVWHVATGLARQPASAAAVDTIERYRFLWDESRLEQQMSRSPLWSKVNLILEERGRQGWRDATRDAYSANLLGCMTLALEQRLSELTGLVDLGHSHYYSNDKVLDGIARFVARGEIPVRDG